MPESAAGIAAAVRNGEISAVAVASSALERSERSQEVLNAFVSLDPEGALDAASRIDAAVAEGMDPGPLADVPIAVKDLFDHAVHRYATDQHVLELRLLVLERIDPDDYIVLG